MISMKSSIGKCIRDSMQPGGRQGLHGEMEHVQLLLKEHGFLMRRWKLRTSLGWRGHIFNVRNAAKSFTLTCQRTPGNGSPPFFHLYTPSSSSRANSNVIYLLRSALTIPPKFTFTSLSVYVFISYSVFQLTQSLSTYYVLGTMLSAGKAFLSPF